MARSKRQIKEGTCKYKALGHSVYRYSPERTICGAPAGSPTAGLAEKCSVTSEEITYFAIENRVETSASIILRKSSAIIDCVQTPVRTGRQCIVLSETSNCVEHFSEVDRSSKSEY